MDSNEQTSYAYISSGRKNAQFTLRFHLAASGRISDTYQANLGRDFIKAKQKAAKMAAKQGLPLRAYEPEALNNYQFNRDQYHRLSSQEAFQFGTFKGCNMKGIPFTHMVKPEDLKFLAWYAFNAEQFTKMNKHSQHYVCANCKTFSDWQPKVTEPLNVKIGEEITVKGTIVSRKWDQTMYGSCLKVTVKDADGRVFWMSTTSKTFDGTAVGEMAAIKAKYNGSKGTMNFLKGAKVVVKQK